MTDWDAVVREYGPAVWRTACRLLTREADAADCFQNTFVSAVELAAGEPVRNWSAVLKRLATARAIELLRARYRTAVHSCELPDELPTDPTAPDPIAAAIGSELAEALRLALSTIDAQQAEVFCLICLEGLSNGGAAELLGITPNHAGVLLHRARAALRERLRAFGPHCEHTPGGHT
jgi:RNA polymerase sigma-70 factor, ECF subfamily